MTQPAWLKRLEALKAEHAPATKEKARREALPRRTLSQACRDVGCPHLAGIMAGAKSRLGKALRVGFCRRRDCPRDKADA